MKKGKREKNSIKNRSGGMKRKLPGRLLSLICALILVLSTVFLDLGHISRAYAFGDELYLETEAEETAEAGIETQAADPGDDGSEINTEFTDDTSEDSDEVFVEEAKDADGADFSSGDNLDEQDLAIEDEPEIADDSAAETVTYTQLINNDTVEVRAEAPAGALPEGAKLVVKPVRNNTDDAEETEKYNTLTTKLTELAQTKAQNLEGFLPYNISFTDSDGNPVEPAEKVSYSFQYKEAAAPELTDPTKVTVSITELKKNKETSEYELTELKAEEDKATLETNENKQLQKAGFQSADTAVFAFVWNSTAETVNNVNNEGTQEVTPVGTVEITADEVNLREAPSTEAEILATATAGTQFPLLETVTAEDESTWYKVSYTADTAAFIRSDMAVVLDENQEEEVPAEEAPAEITRYDYQSDEVNVKVTLTDPADLPDNAELSVTPVELSQEAEEQIAEEAIKEKKAIANIRSYDIKFLVDGEEVQPGATVKVEVSFPDEETVQDAAVYHVDQDEKVENMDGSINEEGNVEFETTHFSTYVIVNTKQGDINVTVEHYNATTKEKIYADDSRTLHVGQKLNPKKATNWEISEVIVSTGSGSDSTYNDVDEIQLVQDATVKVYYTPSTGTFAGAPTFFDYTVKAGESGGKSYSINMEDNYTDKDSNRFAMGGGDNYSSYTTGKYSWSKNGYSVNGWTSPNGATITGLMDGLNDDGSVRFKNCADPGLFTDSDVKVTVNNQERYLRRVYRNYTLDFTRSGDTYQLSGIKDGNGNSVTGNYNGTTGYNFFPLDNVSVDYEGARTSVASGETSDQNVVAGNHNYYFGMRYDIEFSIGDYVGPLNYTFKGDDDMWVILDDEKVVIDLGGIHNAVEGSVDLWNYLTQGNTTTHTLTVLYLERGAGASNCYMNFTLPNATISQVTSDPLGTLTFQKVNKNSESLEGATFGLYTDRDCTTLVATASSNAEGNVTFNKLREGTYYLKEIQAPDGYVTSANVWTVKAEKTSDTEVTVTLEDSAGKKVENPKTILNEKPEEVIESSMVSNKTAKVKDWDKRTYDIEITASSTSTSTSNITKKAVADIMLVLDVSGSMADSTYTYTYVADNTADGRNTLKTGTTYYIEVNGSYQSLQYNYNWNSSYWYVGNNRNNKATNSQYSNCKIYSRNTQTKLAALQSAVNQFITDTAAKSPDSKIGITAFSSSGYGDHGKNKELLKVGDNEAILKDFVDKLNANGGTDPAVGLTDAKNKLDAVKLDGKPKYVILFTDGEPTGGGNTWNTTAQRNAESKALELRTAGYTVYTIGFALGNQATKFLAGDGTDDYPGIASPGCAKTADTATSLGEIFKEIQQTITNNIDLTGVRITDVIDSRFEILNDDGQPITKDNVGNGVKLKNGGTVKFDDAGNQYIEWTDETIPNQVRGEWKKTITVKAKDNYIGGNNVTTNAPGSMIDTGYEQVNLPFPAVNVKVNMEVANKTVTIYKGDQTPTEAEILNQLFDKTNTTTSYDEIKVDKSKVTVRWYSDKSCEDKYEIKMEQLADELAHPTATTEYYIKVTYDAGKTTPESNTNTDGNFAGTETGDTYIASATNVDDRNKETKRTYGVYRVEVISGEIGIIKNLVDQDGKPATSTENQEFTFRVTKKLEDGSQDSTFKPVEVKITVPAGQTTASMTNVDELTNLSRGIYEVEEIKVPKEYKTAGADVIVKDDQTAGTDCKYSVADDNSYKVTFKLGYEMDTDETDTDVIKVGYDANGKKCYTYDEKDGGKKGLVTYNNTLITTDLDLKKIDKDGKRDLTGARFKLEKWEVAEGETEDGWKSVSDAYDSITVDNGNDARELVNLLAGRYKLTEIEAPKGYSLLGASIYFKVEDGKVILTDENGTVKEATQTMWTLDEENLVLTIRNTEVYSLPSSGGPGIYGFTISGVAFITAALLLFITNKRKEDEAKIRSTH